MRWKNKTAFVIHSWVKRTNVIFGFAARNQEVMHCCKCAANFPVLSRARTIKSIYITDARRKSAFSCRHTWTSAMWFTQKIKITMALHIVVPWNALDMWNSVENWRHKLSSDSATEIQRNSFSSFADFYLPIITINKIKIHHKLSQ